MDFEDFLQGSQWARRLPLVERRELAYSLLLSLPRHDVVDFQAYLTIKLQKDIIGELPVELGVMIFAHLPLDDLLACGLVSRKWNRVANDQAMWHELCEESSPPVRAVKTTWLDLDLHRSRATVESDQGPYAMFGGVRTNVWERGLHWRQPAVQSQTLHETVASHLPTRSPLPIPNYKHLLLVDRILGRRMKNSTIPRSIVLNTMASSSAGGLDGHSLAIYCVQLLHHSMHITRPRSCAGECATHPGFFPVLPAAHSPHCPERVSTVSRDWMLSGSRDHTMRLWTLTPTAHVVKIFTGHDSSVLSLCARAGFAVAGGGDGRLCLWELEGSTEPLKAIQAHSDSVMCVRMDEWRVVTCSKDRSIRTFTLSLEPLLTLAEPEGHVSTVNAVALSHDFIVSASGDRTVRVWNVETGALLHDVQGYTRGIACLDVDFSTQTVITGADEVRAVRFGQKSSEGIVYGLACTCGMGSPQGCTRCFSGHSDIVRSVRLTRDLVITGSYDATIKVWDRQGRLVTDLDGAHAGRILAVTSDKTRIVSAGFDARIVIWVYSAGLDTAFLDPV